MLVNMLSFFLLFSAYAQSAPTLKGRIYSALKEASAFQVWLGQHREAFLRCRPQRKGSLIELCDKTEVSVKEIGKLLRLSPAALKKELQAKGFKFEVLCKEEAGRRQNFGENCLKESPRKSFQEISSLHGQFLPLEKTILLYSTASTGSLVHEYIHALQFQNERKVFGRRYKAERVQIQQSLDTAFLELIAHIESEEKAGKKEKELAPWLVEAKKLSDALMAFSYWQKLIDERNIFLLYTEFAKEIGVAAEDEALARKNLGFLCRDPVLAQDLRDPECKN
jgi:hypothetical protein